MLKLNINRDTMHEQLYYLAVHLSMILDVQLQYKETQNSRTFKIHLVELASNTF